MECEIDQPRRKGEDEREIRNQCGCGLFLLGSESALLFCTHTERESWSKRQFWSLSVWSLCELGRVKRSTKGKGEDERETKGNRKPVSCCPFGGFSKGAQSVLFFMCVCLFLCYIAIYAIVEYDSYIND